MRFEPGTRVIDDPGLADRVTSVRMTPQSYETAEDLATEKRMTAQVHAGKAASPAQPASKSRTGTTPQPKTRDSHEKDQSSERKKESHPNSQKRQWIAPSASNEDILDRGSKPSQLSSQQKTIAEERKEITATFGEINKQSLQNKQTQKP